jgi:hypothetical protein
MTSDPSRPSEHVLKVPVDAPPEPPLGDRLAMALRGFGPIGIAAMLVIILVGNYPVAPLAAILVLVWVHWSRTPWREIGYAGQDIDRLAHVCTVCPDPLP